MGQQVLTYLSLLGGGKRISWDHRRPDREARNMRLTLKQ